MSRHRSHASPWLQPRHPMVVWLALGAVFGISAGVNLFLASIDTQVWPFVVGFALVAVALWCVFMAWREYRERC
jgi:protein-S-isoprenylcysteine O-methyltransferase Ste14